MEELIKVPDKRSFRRKRQLEQDLAHVNEEVYKRNLELARTNKILSLLQSIDTLVLESQEPLKQLCNHLAQNIASATEYPFVTILGFPHHSDKEFEVYGYGIYGEVPVEQLKPLDHIRLAIDYPWFLDKERTVFINLTDVTLAKIEQTLGCTNQEAKKLKEALPIKSLYLMKLLARQKLVGMMVIGLNSENSESLHEADRTLFERLSEAVGVALDNKLLFEENQRVLKQLQQKNEKLKALDEAKDEFISMASHQLRTPLTSVKGYVSMVMEGDAGTLKPKQRILLDQAFSSSQRMVYLIADLLNVSRLRTGKFVIEPTPTNLANVVESELKQLKETAKARHLKLEFKKPKKFPILMLDETKIRQVIMNFADNAIYYTPAGGEIHVYLKETPRSVEFTVVDNGIGVPADQQHKLFTKFFRAGNARSSRPDGTGLGLFMAKKVVIAQKGAIIFKSEAGKGSTFGFSFPKKNLAPH